MITVFNKNRPTQDNHLIFKDLFNGLFGCVFFNKKAGDLFGHVRGNSYLCRRKNKAFIL